MLLNLYLFLFNYILPICFFSIILSVLLGLVFKFLKFPENNFKKALSAGFVIYIGYFLIDIVFSRLLANVSIPFKEFSLIHPLPILGALILGTFVIQKIYGSSLKKSFASLLLVVAVLMVLMPVIIYGLLSLVVW